jgi:hypothetical protein
MKPPSLKIRGLRLDLRPSASSTDQLFDPLPGFPVLRWFRGVPGPSEDKNRRTLPQMTQMTQMDADETTVPQDPSPPS